MRRYAPMAVTLVVLVVPFVGIISVKYHQLTLGTSGAYNQHVVGPTTFAMGQPIDYMGQLAPPNKTAVSVWEDPTIFTRLLPGWSPLQSRTNLGYFINNILYMNVRLIVAMLAAMGPLVPAAVVVTLIGCFQRKYFRREHVIFTGIIGVTILAYASVFVVQRYLMPVAVVAVAGLGLWLAGLLRSGALNHKQIIAGGLLVCMAMGLSAGYGISSQSNPDIAVYQTAQMMRGSLPKGAKTVADNFAQSVQACYYLHLSCYNVIAPPAEGQFQAYYQQLKGLGISYYINYHTRDNDPVLTKFVSQYFTQTAEYQAKGLTATVYQLR
jgi:hypothetical protein